jgi:hypothetical protein
MVRLLGGMWLCCKIVLICEWMREEIQNL